jgi:RHS repeat-associated protein
VDDANGGTQTYDYALWDMAVIVGGTAALPVEYNYDTIHRFIGSAQRYSYQTLDGQQVTDQVSSAIAYDELNRKVLEWDDRTPTTTQYTYLDDQRAVLVATGRWDSDTKKVQVVPEEGLGLPTRYDYDPAGNLAKVTDPLGNVTQYRYDERNRVTAVTSAADTKDEATTTYCYQVADCRTPTMPANVNWVKDPLGNVTAMTYDAGNRITKVQEYGPHDPQAAKPLREANYVSDPAGNLTEVHDAQGGVWKYGYDPAGRLISMTDALGKTETRQYDQEGNLWQTLDRNGHQLTREYDPLNRLTRVAAGDTTTAFQYDKAGRRTVMTDTTAGKTDQTRYDYWPGTSRVRVLTQPDGRGLFYQYDAVGKVTSITDGHVVTGPVGPKVSTGSDGTTTTYWYDDAGRLHFIADPDWNRIFLGYDAANNQTSISYPNGASGHFGYDTANRPISVNWQARDGSTLGQYGYRYDGASNVTQRTEPGRSTDYQYTDGLNRLTDATVTDTTSKTVEWTHYQFDLAGNRLQQDVTLTDATGAKTKQTTRYGFDHNNRLTSESGPAGDFTYGWDNNGNEKTDGRSRFSYDWLNRLTGVDMLDGNHIDYRYDGDGRLLLRKPKNGSDTRFHWDRNSLYLETDGTDHFVARTISAGGPLLRQVENAGKSYYLFDAHGDVRGLTDATGHPVASYGYDAYGQATGKSGDFPNPFRFAGAYQDSTTGLYLMGARFYQPGTGRFLTEDTAFGNPGQPWTFNPFTYAWGNPLAWVDPSGHWPEWMTRAWDSVENWAANYRWDVAAQGVFEVATGAMEIAAGSLAVGLGCASVVFCPAAVAGGYAMLDGGSRALSGVADIIGANSKDWQPESANVLERGYQAVLGDERGRAVYETVGAMATVGATGMAAFLKLTGYDPEVASAGCGSNCQEAGAAKGGVYTLEDNDGTVVRTGRTKNLAVRAGQHFRQYEGKYDFVPRYRTDDYPEQRGLEHMLYEEHRDTAFLNKIKPIWDFNPFKAKYLEAATQFLDRLNDR